MNLDPIDSLLCDCLGRASDQDLIARLNLLSLIEWNALWQRACKQRVPGLVYQRVKKLQPDRPFPDSILEKMRSISIGIALKNIQQWPLLGQLLTAFRNSGIPVIVLKGAYLGEIIYQDIGLRGMADIDLMVPKPELASTIKMLHEMGYSSKYESLESKISWDNELSSFQKPKFPTVDIHWALERPTAPFKINVEELWLRAKEINVAGVKVKVLAPEDLLLHLCLHNAFRHRFAMGLRNLCDIHEVLLHFSNSLDWQKILEQAREWNAVRCLNLNLYLIQELLGAEIPGKAIGQTKPQDLNPEIEQNILRRLFEEKNRSKAMLPPLAQVWGPHRFKDILKVLFKYAFPTHDTMAGIYSIDPSTLRIYFYYPLRWLYLIRRWGRLIWQLTSHKKEVFKELEIMKKDLADDAWISDWLALKN